jgi:hypothetical protein
LPKLEKKKSSSMGLKYTQEITHLFLADDSLMLCRPTKEDFNLMKIILTKYQRASGQLELQQVRAYF